jgi:hypothetical protein
MFHVTRLPSAMLFAAASILCGCFYPGPTDPCGEDPVATPEGELYGCDPGYAEVVVIHDRWETYPFHCDVSGDAYITWWLRYPSAESTGAQDEDLRAIAEGVPYLELQGNAIPWEAGVEDGFLLVEVSPEPDAPIAPDRHYWWLKLMEPLP